MSRYSTAWIARRLKRARRFEVQKMKILLNMKRSIYCNFPIIYEHFNEKDERELKLLRALMVCWNKQRVCVDSMASESADQSRFMVLYDTITRQNNVKLLNFYAPSWCVETIFHLHYFNSECVWTVWPLRLQTKAGSWSYILLQTFNSVLLLYSLC